MTMLSEGHPTKQEDNLTMPDSTEPKTFTGNRALMVDEPLIFEIGSPDRSGVDLPEAPQVEAASVVSTARRRSPFPASPKPKWSAITPASAARITRLMSACSRSAAAR